MKPELNIENFIKTIEENYKKWKTPVVTLIANRGSSPFNVLVSTLLSLRTKDEVTSLAYSKLSKLAKTPYQIIKLDLKTIEQAIYPTGFYRTKAKRLKEVSKIIIDKHNGKVPDNMEELLNLPGVGRKTANLVLIEGFKKKAICVDTHVHRISNRIGYVKTKDPNSTEEALRKKLPKKYWIKYNEILVAFGQTVCKPISPLCSKCNFSQVCPRKGVVRSR